ncbi:hypothetical protein LINGRAHAP2_LOCUS5431 [Linum grandiflorum]
MASNIKLLSSFLFISLLMISPSASTRHEPGSSSPNPGDFFGPGTGFGVPEFGKGWDMGGGGYGSGYGGPKGGHSKNGVYRPTVVCKEKGPCLNKKLRCPAKCFTSYSHSGKGYGGGGGGGGCTMDCKKKCVAYC